MKVKGQHFRTIWPVEGEAGIVRIIDQRQLPHRFVVEDLVSLDNYTTAISEMHVRGAGLIGATAAFGMYCAARSAPEANPIAYLADAGRRLQATRPTARNLSWAVERQLAAAAGIGNRAALVSKTFETACAVADEDAEFCRRLGEHGLKMIRKISRQKNGAPVNILTHCNAGWLAFVDYGSATAPIYAAHREKIAVHVWVDETRPWNQGAKLTAWELAEEGVPHTLITDNAGGHLMQHGMVDLVLVGTDRTTRSGDVANKIGTYLKALAARDNDVPFYVALPSSTFDWQIRDGLMAIPIEERSGDEIKYVRGLKADLSGEETVLVAPTSVKAANYAFDVTPARLVSGLVTERGICAAEEASILALFPERA